MHRNIALLIKKMCDESPYKHFSCEVISHEGSGFWAVIIYFTERGDAHSESLIRSLCNIGMVYGESLSVDDKKEIVEVR